MNDIGNFSTCERAGDLVSVLYGEASESERHDFELHLKQCGNCRAEFAAFAQVRESIGEWRDEVLTGFISSPTAPARGRKSAIAALRQFFDLSPLWMKGAVGFAAVVFCVLAALAVMRLQSIEQVSPVATVDPNAVYTKQDLERAVQEALAKRQKEQRVVETAPAIVDSSPVKNSSVADSRRVKSRRPFTKAEREQLAAELRLFSSSDDADLDLLEDRINEQR